MNKFPMEALNSAKQAIDELRATNWGYQHQEVLQILNDLAAAIHSQMIWDDERWGNHMRFPHAGAQPQPVEKTDVA